MRVYWAIALFVGFGTSFSGGQQATAQEPVYHQTPDKEGVYFVGPEVTPPMIVQAVAAVYTDDMPRGSRGVSVWSVVIRADGTVADAHLAEPLGTAFDAAAIDAIHQCRFAPGRLRGEPVAVRIGVAVAFHLDKNPSNPMIAVLERDLDHSDAGPSATTKPKVGHPEDTSPLLIHAAEATPWIPALKEKYRGVVVVSALVGEDGLTSDVRVIRRLGMGLDEKATEAVRHYRFMPAMKDGKPVATRISIDVNCNIY
jgi:TonB family protein